MKGRTRHGNAMLTGRLALLLALSLLAGPAVAQVTLSGRVFLSGGASLVPVAAPPPSLSRGDLSVDARRICQSTDGVNCDGTWDSGWWWSEPPAIPNTSGWSETVIDCSAGGAECSYSEIQTELSAATSANEIITIPFEGDGTYDLSGGQLTMTASNTLVRCEDNVVLNFTGDLDYDTCTGGISGGESYFCIGTASRGASETWTSGFTEGLFTVGVADATTFPVDGYVSLSMTARCTSIFNFATNYNNSDTQHLARVTARDEGADTITLDRPTRYDISGCSEGKVVEVVTMSEYVGLENCGVTIPITTGNFNSNTIMVGAYPWAQDNTFDGGSGCGSGLYQSYRGYFFGNDFAMPQQGGDTCAAMQISNSTGWTVENNTFSGLPYQATYIDHGAEGGVFAYNYLAGGGNTEKGVFFHGFYPRENLVEGNVAYSYVGGGDAIWGTNGPAVIYRNRLLDDGGDMGHSGYVNQGVGTGSPSSTESTGIANSMAWMIGGSPHCSGSGETNPDECAAADDDHRNFFLQFNFCDGGTRDGDDCINIDGDADTDCGDGIGSCTRDAPPNPQGWDDNEANVSSAPAGWSSPTIPVSLYRQSKPSWWCDDVDFGIAPCTWDTDGIGALGDNFSGTLCRIPAQIRADGDNCV